MKGNIKAGVRLIHVLSGNLQRGVHKGLCIKGNMSQTFAAETTTAS